MSYTVFMPSEFNARQDGDYFTPIFKLISYSAVAALLYFVMHAVEQAETIEDPDDLTESIRFIQRLFTYGVGALVVYLSSLGLMSDSQKSNHNPGSVQLLKILSLLLTIAYTAAVAAALAGNNEFNEKYDQELTAALAIPLLAAVVCGLYYVYSRNAKSIKLFSFDDDSVLAQLVEKANTNRVSAGFIAFGGVILLSALLSGIVFMLSSGVQESPQAALDDLSLLNDFMGYALIAMGLLYGMYRYLEASHAAFEKSGDEKKVDDDEHAKFRGVLSALLIITGVIFTVVFAEQSTPEASCTSVLAGVSFLKAGENMAKNVGKPASTPAIRA